VTTSSTLDTAELATWLTRVTQTIDRSLHDTARAEALGELRVDLDSTTASVPVLAQLALLDDCLRVAHMALAPGGAFEPDELARVTNLVAAAARKYFQVLPLYESFGEGIETAADVERFLVTHHSDAGAFGYANRTPWRGLYLARHVDTHTRNAAPLRDLERMFVRVMDTVFAGRLTNIESAARKKLRELLEPPAPTGQDPRAVAFCRPDGPEVFSSVAHGSQVHERDPFDVESIHAEAREVFHRQVVRATTPEQHTYGHGRTLLLLGDAGSGKTHLLRALRQQVHSQRLGYVGYMQLSSEVGDYARYVLRNLIDSLERPYDPPGFAESGLLYLSDGLAEGRGIIPADELEAARTAELGSEELDTLIGGMVDRILRSEGLDHLDSALVHALLLLQRRDPALQRRVIRFLRCEHLNAYEQRMLGLAPRTEPDDPMRTLKQLGTIAYELQLASLVLLVDQVEDAVPDGKTVTRLQQAVDVLRGVADAVPSAVVVLSCLEDVYVALRDKLSRSVIDRLERDPAPVRLASQRQRSELEAMLVRRLDHLYSTFDVSLQDDDLLFPFTAEQLDAVTNYRARDAIARFREIHESCIAAGSVVAPTTTPSPAPAPPVVPSSDVLDRAWNDALSASDGIPDDDDGVLALVASAFQAVAVELGVDLQIRVADTHLVLQGRALTPRVIQLCNGRAQGGHLADELDRLYALAGPGAVPVALRSSDFAFKPKSKINRQVGRFVQTGGRTVVIEERQLRAVHAARVVERAAPDAFPAWQHANKPISHLAFVRAILDLDQAPRVAPQRDTSPLPTPTRRPAKPTPSAPMPIARAATANSGQLSIADPTQVRIGETTTMRKEPVYLAVSELARHLAFLGTTGSGKTTAALAVIEQLLERDVSVLLVDRKGDLARYASDAWWHDAKAPDHDRRVALRQRIDISLYTPGNAQGQPLRVPLIPMLADASSQEREQLAGFAASGLAAMMGYGSGTTHRHKQSVLQCAIGLHAEDGDVTLDLLRDTIDRPDPELLASVGPLQRFFAPLAEDLHTLRIQRGNLLGGDGDTLDIEMLLPATGSRPRLAIINTQALSEVAVLQFWVSRLLVELGRLARKRPSKTLQAVTLFDEADAYIPATGNPPTKEPMFDLLRRARSGGIGVMLATQNPGDLDYKARDNIGTWLVGKIAQDRAIEKMRNLLASYPNVGPRLAGQPTGHFFLIGSAGAREVKCDVAMMATEQLPDADVVELARETRR
jgi:adenylylsulfate kinase-like enzyme